MGSHQEIPKHPIKFLFQIYYFRQTRLGILPLFGRKQDNHLFLGKVVVSERLNSWLDNISRFTSGWQEHHVDHFAPVHDFVLNRNQFPGLTTNLF